MTGWRQGAPDPVQFWPIHAKLAPLMLSEHVAGRSRARGQATGKRRSLSMQFSRNFSAFKPFGTGLAIQDNAPLPQERRTGVPLKDHGSRFHTRAHAQKEAAVPWGRASGNDPRHCLSLYERMTSA